VSERAVAIIDKSHIQKEALWPPMVGEIRERKKVGVVDQRRRYASPVDLHQSEERPLGHS
jgi:hypothetical protein